MRTACPWPWKLHNSRLAQGGAVFGGGKGGSGGTTYQTQQVQIPPEVLARYNAVNARAEQAAAQPFQPYTGQFVAPINATQQQAIQQTADASTAYQPYFQAATAALGQGAGQAYPFFGAAAQNINLGQAASAPYTGMATLAGLGGMQAVNPAALNIGAYQNPYIEQVIAPTMASLRQQQQAEQSQLMGQQAMRGAFGGDRGSIASANLARQQALASGQTEAGLRSQAYQQALGAAQQQQGVQLGAEQANRAAMAGFAPQALAIGQQAFQQPLQAAQAQQGLGQGLLGYGQGLAQSLAGLGQGATQTGLAGAQQLLGAGTLEQQTQQALNQALYNQYLQQQGYPFQVAQFLANIAEGTGALSGSTTTGVTTQPTSFFSDERVKEDIVEIGRTHDGQKIIKFRYKDEPPGTSHIGLSAQDVERHHPEAVSETPEGIKAVDYDLATRHAEKHSGGSLEGLGAASEGGAVMPERAGLGFAGGGAADYSQQIYQMMTQGARATPGGGGNPYGATGTSGYMPPLRQSAPRQLVRPNLPTPTPLPSELEQGLGALQKTAQGAQTVTGLYKMGKEGLLGSKATKDDPATGGLLGRGGEWDPEKGWLGSLTSSATTKPSAHGGARSAYAAGGMLDPMQAVQDPNQAMQGVFGQAPWAGGGGATGIVPPEQGGAARKLDAPKLTTPSAGGGKGAGLGDVAGAIDATGKLIKGAGEAGDWITDKLKMAGLENDALNNIAAGAAGMATGGRTGLAAGGMGSLPGAQAANPIVPDAVLEEGDKDEKLNAPGLNPPPGGGGGGAGGRDKTASTAMKAAGMAANFIPGVGPFIGAGLNIGSAFVKNGGRIGYEDGGAPTDSVPAPAPTGVAPPKQDEFLGRLTPHVLKASEQTGIDPRIILAQSALETGYGKAAPGYNYFGIKSHGRPGGQELQTREYDPQRGYYNTTANFRAYASPEESVQDYAKFMMENRIYNKMRAAKDFDTQLAELGKSGYASDTDYAKNVGSIARNIEIDPQTGTARWVKPVQTYAPQAGLGGAGKQQQQQQPSEPMGLGNIDELVSRYKTPMGVGISNRPEKSTMDWLTSESTIVPAVAGIGAMLAGGSPYFLPNLGKGLYAGASAYGDLAKDIRRQDIAQQQADISQQQVDVEGMARLQATYADLVKKHDLARRQGNDAAAATYSKALDQLQSAIMARAGIKGVSVPGGKPAGGGAPAGGAPAGGAPAGGGAGTAPQPEPAGAPKDKPWAEPRAVENMTLSVTNKPIIPDRDPAELRRRASGMIGEEARHTLDLAAQYEKEYRQSGMIPVVGGGNEYYKGYAENQRQREQGEQNKEWNKSFVANSEARKKAIAANNKILEIAKTFEPGAFAEKKAQIESALRGLGINPSKDVESAADFQTLVKAANLQAMQLGNTGSSGLTNEKLGQSLASVANPGLQPGAFRSIASQQKALLEYEDKYAGDFQKAVKEVPWVDPNQFRADWEKKPENNLDAIMKKAYAETPVRGATFDIRAIKPGTEQREMLEPQDIAKMWSLANPGKPVPKFTQGGEYLIKRNEDGTFNITRIGG